METPFAAATATKRPAEEQASAPQPPAKKPKSEAAPPPPWTILTPAWHEWPLESLNSQVLYDLVEQANWINENKARFEQLLTRIEKFTRLSSRDNIGRESVEFAKILTNIEAATTLTYTAKLDQPENGDAATNTIPKPSLVWAPASSVPAQDFEAVYWVHQLCKFVAHRTELLVRNRTEFLELETEVSGALRNAIDAITKTFNAINNNAECAQYVTGAEPYVNYEDNGISGRLKQTLATMQQTFQKAYSTVVQWLQRAQQFAVPLVDHPLVGPFGGSEDLDVSREELKNSLGKMADTNKKLFELLEFYIQASAAILKGALEEEKLAPKDLESLKTYFSTCLKARAPRGEGVFIGLTGKPKHSLYEANMLARSAGILEEQAVRGERYKAKYSPFVLPLPQIFPRGKTQLQEIARTYDSELLDMFKHDIVKNPNFLKLLGSIHERFFASGANLDAEVLIDKFIDKLTEVADTLMDNRPARSFIATMFSLHPLCVVGLNAEDIESLFAPFGLSQSESFNEFLAAMTHGGLMPCLQKIEQEIWPVLMLHKQSVPALQAGEEDLRNRFIRRSSATGVLNWPGDPEKMAIGFSYRYASFFDVLISDYSTSKLTMALPVNNAHNGSIEWIMFFGAPLLKEHCTQAPKVFPSLVAKLAPEGVTPEYVNSHPEPELYTLADKLKAHPDWRVLDLIEYADNTEIKHVRESLGLWRHLLRRTTAPLPWWTGTSRLLMLVEQDAKTGFIKPVEREPLYQFGFNRLHAKYQGNYRLMLSKILVNLFNSLYIARPFEEMKRAAHSDFLIWPPLIQLGQSLRNIHQELVASAPATESSSAVFKPEEHHSGVWISDKLYQEHMACEPNKILSIIYNAFAMQGVHYPKEPDNPSSRHFINCAPLLGLPVVEGKETCYVEEELVMSDDDPAKIAKVVADKVQQTKAFNEQNPRPPPRVLMLFVNHGPEPACKPTVQLFTNKVL